MLKLHYIIIYFFTESLVENGPIWLEELANELESKSHKSETTTMSARGSLKDFIIDDIIGNMDSSWNGNTNTKNNNGRNRKRNKNANKSNKNTNTNTNGNINIFLNKKKEKQRVMIGGQEVNENDKNGKNMNINNMGKIARPLLEKDADYDPKSDDNYNDNESSVEQEYDMITQDFLSQAVLLNDSLNLHDNDNDNDNNNNDDDNDDGLNMQQDGIFSLNCMSQTQLSTRMETRMEITGQETHCQDREKEKNSEKINILIARSTKQNRQTKQSGIKRTYQSSNGNNFNIEKFDSSSNNNSKSKNKSKNKNTSNNNSNNNNNNKIDKSQHTESICSSSNDTQASIENTESMLNTQPTQATQEIANANGNESDDPFGPPAAKRQRILACFGKSDS